MTEKPWTVPRLWDGQTVFVIGAGPSLRNFDLQPIANLPTITVNTSYKLCPWRQFIFYADHRWADWHLGELRQLKNTTLVSTSGLNKPGLKRKFLLKKPNNGEHPAIELDDPTTVMGRDSGTCAINLAYHLGAQTIVLAGFDMSFEEVKPDDRDARALRQPLQTTGTKNRQPLTDKLSHWHQEHPVPSREDNYRKRFLSQWPGVKERLNSRSVDILTITPTAIKCLDLIPLEDVLCRYSSKVSLPKLQPDFHSSAGIGSHPGTVILPFPTMERPRPSPAS